MLLPNPHPTAMDEDDSEWTIPRVETTEDFELAKAVKEKGRPTGRYETLVGSSQLKKVLVNWDSVFVQFRDPNGEWFAHTSYIALHRWPIYAVNFPRCPPMHGAIHAQAVYCP